MLQSRMLHYCNVYFIAPHWHYLDVLKVTLTSLQLCYVTIIEFMLDICNANTIHNSNIITCISQMIHYVLLPSYVPATCHKNNIVTLRVTSV